MPGSILALVVWRLPEPSRGESDVAAEQPEPSLPVQAPVPPERDAGVGALLRDVRVAVRVKTLRSLMVGSAIAAGALSGLGFWAAAFYERHTSLGTGGSAGLVGVLILVGAITGTFVAGRVVDRIRDRFEGAPMLLAGVCQGVGAVLLLPTFLDVPLWFRIPVQGVAVAFIVGGLVAIPVMITEVVPPTIRGIAFSVTGFLGAIAGAISPLLIGFIADQFDYVVDGEVKGNLANAFLIVTPLGAGGRRRAAAGPAPRRGRHRRRRGPTRPPCPLRAISPGSEITRWRSRAARRHDRARRAGSSTRGRAHGAGA